MSQVYTHAPAGHKPQQVSCPQMFGGPVDATNRQVLPDPDNAPDRKGKQNANSRAAGKLKDFKDVFSQANFLRPRKALHNKKAPRAHAGAARHSHDQLLFSPPGDSIDSGESNLVPNIGRHRGKSSTRARKGGKINY